MGSWGLRYLGPWTLEHLDRLMGFRALRFSA
jgi:hypothetical protein